MFERTNLIKADGLRKLLTATALTAALSCLLAAFWIDLKAIVAQQLIAKAWAQTLQSTQHGARLTQANAAVKPWPWADTWPVAKIHLKQKEFYVLANASGHALAFGPAHISQSALPGQGHTAIAAHKDTHFKSLENINPGELIRLENTQGQVFHYKVYHTEVVNSQEKQLTLHEQQELTLVTCYPFNSHSINGSLRLLVHAHLVSKEQIEIESFKENKKSYFL